MRQHSRQSRTLLLVLSLIAVLMIHRLMVVGQSFGTPLILAERTPRPNAMFGHALAIGDFNARGSLDLAVSNSEGRVTLFYGEPTLDSNPDLTITGKPEIGFGATLAAGDFNGDGRTDLAVAAPDGDVDEESGMVRADGQVFIYWGGPNFNSRADVTISHPPIDPYIPLGFFGDSLAVADINGDRIDDLIVGIPGEDQVQIFFGGRNFGRRIDFTLSGPELFSFFGSPVGAADVNADGKTDLIVAASLANNTLGALYIYLGSASGLFNRTPVILSNPDATGENQGFGAPLAVVDLDRDGALDIVVGAPQADASNLSRAGRIYVFFGPIPSSRPPLTIQNPQPQSNARFGSSFALADLTGDGIVDLVASESDGMVSNREKAGRVFVFPGAISAQGFSFSQTPMILLPPTPQNNGLFGAQLAIADINKDLLPDLIVSAIGMTIRGNTGAGQVYIFLSQKST